jgi:hypothetical protein
MLIRRIEEITIYESPDGGKTVYSRSSGDPERKLVFQDPQISWKARWQKWYDILQEAENNVPLNDVIKQAEMIYDLIKEPRS